MVFQEMKPEDVRKALEGQVDVVSSAMEQHRLFFSKLSCPRDGSDVIAIVNSKKLFRENAVIPNFLAKCKSCGCEFEPYTQIEVKGPDGPTGPKSF